ncbi:MAG: hypothetical protein K8S97_10135 [Anaerolineae bacterium]|nr:hypothetical protein [Anaerolineae bacterium]
MKRQSMILVLLLLFVALTLAACGGDDDNDDSGNDNASNDNASTTTGGNGPANFTIVGDPAVDQTVTGAFAATDVTNNLVSLLFFESMSGLVVDISNIPYDQTPGTYAIQTTLDMGHVTAEAMNGAANYVTYASTSGTLEITAWNNDTMSGTFEFTAEKDVEDGEDPVIVTVSGEFTNARAPQPAE